MEQLSMGNNSNYPQPELGYLLLGNSIILQRTDYFTVQ